MVLRQVYLLPVSVLLLIIITFSISYTIAVVSGHVQAWFPYISDTGTFEPESCIFAEMLNVGALLSIFYLCLGALCFYIRHRQIAEFYRRVARSHQCSLRMSLIFLWVGYVAAFGTSIVANFQETRVYIVHLLGAFLAFGLGNVYFWAQTVFSYRMGSAFSHRWLCHFRVLLCSISTVCLVLTLAFATMRNAILDNYMMLTNGSLPEGATTPVLLPIIRLLPEDPGYYEHVNSTVCEWVLAMSFLLYFCALAIELRHAVMVPPRLVLNIDETLFPSEPSCVELAKADANDGGVDKYGENDSGYAATPEPGEYDSMDNSAEMKML